MRELLECPICLDELPIECFPKLISCDHHICYQCLIQYLKTEITESRINIFCPQCSEYIHPNDIRDIIKDPIILDKYDTFMVRKVLITDPDTRWCPAPDCGYAAIAKGCDQCPKLKCGRPGCNTLFCFYCKEVWHPNESCDYARCRRALQSEDNQYLTVIKHDLACRRNNIKHCPKCKVLITKVKGSCNLMTCSVCNTEFCWLCLKEVSYMHYLSPSGCTLVGKKPWSRRKKIMCQLGILFGAPVGIALISAVAIPTMIIGIPLRVGKSLHAKYAQAATNRLFANFIVISGVVVSLLISLIFSAIVVVMIILVLFTFVYTVVPVSLCTTMGYGSLYNKSTESLDLDEEQGISTETDLFTK